MQKFNVIDSTTISRLINDYNSRKVYGHPFKIPTNPNIIEEKTIPTDIYSTTTLNKEVFWYKNDSNWKEVMTDRSYETIKYM